jgi:uncharacterized phage protein gp47/JayE
MAAPTTKKHATLVQDAAAAAQATSQTPLDFTQGSVFLALAEAAAGLGTWLQKLYIYALSVTRLVSSQGVWVDTFVGAFGMTRLPAVAATGLVQFSRYSTTGNVAIPVGAQVATTDGSRVFQVYADTTNASYSATATATGAPGYVLLAGANTVAVPVQALVAGTGGNVQAQAITKLQTAVSGIDAVVNTVAFTNGAAAESDNAVKARFVFYIASLSKATRGALAYAISALGLNLQSSFAEFQQPNGTPTDGMNCIFVDDGSGNPPTSVVTAAGAAVNQYRAFGVRVGVFGATLVPANVQIAINVDPTYNVPAVSSAVSAALTTYINGLGLGTTLRYTRLEQIAYEASAGVTNVSSVSLNSGTADLVPTIGQTIKANAIAVNPTSP